ncbi:MAG: hypothetical protein K6A44_03395 [bacterium]|nr:hypothetical protein [bacterium]
MIIKKSQRNNTNIKKAEPIPAPPVEEEDEDTGAFDLLSDTAERQERRRGDRRRGYRRIEDRSLVSRAHEEAKQIKEQAAKDGFQNGIAKAEEELQELREAITSLLGVKEEAYKHYKNDIAIIAVQVAQRILNAQVKLEPATILEITTNVIKEISEEESKITFIVNPADEFVLSEALDKNSVFKNKRATMLIQTSEEIQRGSCKVITNSGQIDATFASQLNIIKKAFEEGIV